MTVGMVIAQEMGKPYYPENHPMRSILLPLLLGATACGGASVPPSEIADTEAAIRSASEMGAESVPSAALHLELAQNQMKEAEELMEEDEGEAAMRALDRAEADANLALEEARTAEAQSKAKEALQKLDELRQNASVYSQLGDS